MQCMFFVFKDLNTYFFKKVDLSDEPRVLFLKNVSCPMNPNDHFTVRYCPNRVSDTRRHASDSTLPSHHANFRVFLDNNHLFLNKEVQVSLLIDLPIWCPQNKQPRGANELVTSRRCRKCPILPGSTLIHVHQNFGKLNLWMQISLIILFMIDLYKDNHVCAFVNFFFEKLLLRNC